MRMSAKKRWMAFLSVCLMAASASACANSWGLRGGKILDAVMRTHRWDDYAVCGEAAPDAAVMGNKYHRVLMLADEEGLNVYTTAVAQPDETRGNAIEVRLEGERLTLSDGERDARYTFARDEWGWTLYEADVGNLHLETTDEAGYEALYAEDASGRAIFCYAPRLESFNEALFPRSVEEVRHHNFMCAALETGMRAFDDGDGGLYRSAVGKGTAPVYSSPFGEAAWRASKGKAAVGLKGEFWIQHKVQMTDAWYACIRYQVRESKQRFGYVRLSDIGEPVPEGSYDDVLIGMFVTARCDTFLTDDPEVSQYPQFVVPKGTLLDCMGVYEGTYALVGGEVRKGRFVDGGAVLWGFVPLRDLELSAGMRNDPREVQADAMERLVGDWQYDAGGGMGPDKISFYPDGTYTGTNVWDGKTAHFGGRYAAVANHPHAGLFWDNPPYELILAQDDASFSVHGLSFDEENGEEIFSLTDWEGSGGYRRVKSDGRDGNDGNG